MADRSRHEGQQPEKPGRRLLKAEFGGQSAMVTTRSEDSDVLRYQPVDRVHQRGTVGLIRVGICRQGQPAACSRFAPVPSASVAGAGAA